MVEIMAGKIYRCPVDDVVFETETNDKRPHHTFGHPECPGPKCREQFELKQTPAERAAIAQRQAAQAVEDARKALNIAQANADAAKKRAEDIASGKAEANADLGIHTGVIDNPFAPPPASGPVVAAAAAANGPTPIPVIG